jgi:hypothetical protein
MPLAGRLTFVNDYGCVTELLTGRTKISSNIPVSQSIMPTVVEKRCGFPLKLPSLFNPTSYQQGCAENSPAISPVFH